MGTDRSKSYREILMAEKVFVTDTRWQCKVFICVAPTGLSDLHYRMETHGSRHGLTCNAPNGADMDGKDRFLTGRGSLVRIKFEWRCVLSLMMVRVKFNGNNDSGG